MADITYEARITAKADKANSYVQRLRGELNRKLMQAGLEPNDVKYTPFNGSGIRLSFDAENMQLTAVVSTYLAGFNETYSKKPGNPRLSLKQIGSISRREQELETRVEQLEQDLGTAQEEATTYQTMAEEVEEKYTEELGEAHRLLARAVEDAAEAEALVNKYLDKLGRTEIDLAFKRDDLALSEAQLEATNDTLSVLDVLAIGGIPDYTEAKKSSGTVEAIASMVATEYAKLHDRPEDARTAMNQDIRKLRAKTEIVKKAIAHLKSRYGLT